MRIELGRLARAGIEAHLGGNVEAAVRTALNHYVAEIQAGRAPIKLPNFCRELNPGEAELVLDLTLGPDCLALLERDATRQGTTASRLAAHCVLIYVAELDRQLERRIAL